MVVIVTPIPPLVPAVLQLIHTGPTGKFANFLQNWFIYGLAVVSDARGVDFQCGKQNVLFGVHNRKYIFKALRRVFTGIHMDMHTATVIDKPTCTA